MSQGLKILIYGYGNPGRQDDGLGNAFTERIKALVEEKGIEGFSFDSNYQLNIEDADAIAEHDVVIFADASTEKIDDFCVSRVEGSEQASFTSHAASPGYVLYLCNTLFQKDPPVYLVHIRGEEWEFQEGLSEQALSNLEAAVRFFEPLVLDPEKLTDPLQLEKKFCQEIKNQ